MNFDFESKPSNKWDKSAHYLLALNTLLFVSRVVLAMGGNEELASNIDNILTLGMWVNAGFVAMDTITETKVYNKSRPNNERFTLIWPLDTSIGLTLIGGLKFLVNLQAG